MRSVCAFFLLLAVSYPHLARADDRQECLNGDSEPFRAISACTRLIGTGSRHMKPADAYYYRGLVC
jgi:hypothetical protein